MKIITLSALYEADYHVNRLFSQRQYWKENSVFSMRTPRKTGCFLYFCGSSAEYTLPRGTLMVPRGSIVYIPCGAVYSTRFFHCDPEAVSTVLIEFTLSEPSGDPFVLTDTVAICKQKADPYLEELFFRAADRFASAVISIASVKAIVLQLLTELGEDKRQQKLNSEPFSSIAAGILYLENEPQGELRMEEIADLCHVSPSTFRRLFKAYAGVSPMEFRITARIERAKRLLAAGTMDGAQVAREVGFEDYAYFCRLFKKRTGVTPGKFKQ